MLQIALKPLFDFNQQPDFPSPVYTSIDGVALNSHRRNYLSRTIASTQGPARRVLFTEYFLKKLRYVRHAALLRVERITIFEDKAQKWTGKTTGRMNFLDY